MPLLAIRRKTGCPLRVSVSLTLGFDSHRLHNLPSLWHLRMRKRLARLPREPIRDSRDMPISAFN